MLGVKLQGLGFLLPPLLGETPVLVWNVTPPSLTVGGRTRKHPFSIVSPCLMPLHHSRMIFSAAHSHSGRYGHPKLPISCVTFQAPRRYWINSWPQSHICKSMYVQLWTNRLFHEWCSWSTEMLTSSWIVCACYGAGVGRGPPKVEVIPWD